MGKNLTGAVVWGVLTALSGDPVPDEVGLVGGESFVRAWLVALRLLICVRDERVGNFRIRPGVNVERGSS